jgi:hypothetical protein
MSSFEPTQRWRRVGDVWGRDWIARCVETGELRRATYRDKTVSAVTAALQQTTARQRLTAIRNALALADDLLAQAYAARDWEALGHASWEAYCAAEIPELRHLKLRAPERRARIQTLRNAAPGISVRELAAATGASVGTVHGDLAAPRPAEPAAGRRAAR